MPVNGWISTETGRGGLVFGASALSIYWGIAENELK